MSMHKIPLTPLEEEGMRLHGLPIGTPSQRSDTFRQGVAWGIGEAKRLREENEKLWMTFVKTADVLDIDTEVERKTPGAPSGVFIREIERLRKDAEVGSAIQRAAAELPAGYIVGISVEADAATVELCFPTGHIKSMDVHDDDNRLAAEINAAIDAARGAK